MSLKPEFAEAAYSGAKCFEYRRCIARISSGDLVVIYESSPTMRITGCFTIGTVRHGDASLSALEPETSMRSKVAQYLAGATRATALEICSARRLNRDRSLSEITGLARPPQSYSFLGGTADELLRHLEEG